jgi:hypothetical protein
MGLRPKELTEQAATHLLSILKTQVSVLYSSFYDGSEESNHRLCAGIGISPKDGEWYSAEGLMDNAVAQLERQEVVTIEWLESQLCDGEPDYRITLT